MVGSRGRIVLALGPLTQNSRVAVWELAENRGAYCHQRRPSFASDLKGEEMAHLRDVVERLRDEL